MPESNRGVRPHDKANDHRYLLPNKFVSNLLRGNEGQNLILNPKIVAEAFSSIDDPLVILCSGDVRPNIDAPCAIFVELTNSREEIMSVLFQRKTSLSIQNPSNDDACGSIPEIACANTLADANLIVKPVDGCRRELQMKWKDLKRIFFYFQNEFEIYVDTLATALEDGKFRTGEYVTLVHCVYSELKALLEAFTSQTQITFKKKYENLMEWPERSGPKLDDFLKRYGKSQNVKCGKMVVPERSSTTEVEQTGDASNGVNTPYAKNKNREINKGKKGKGKRK
nr:UvrD-like helicase, ATP-binding domain, P-loop containing nucleoside triphosphate hydrolase [Tanacetum cinerariifolium]